MDIMQKRPLPRWSPPTGCACSVRARSTNYWAVGKGVSGTLRTFGDTLTTQGATPTQAARVGTFFQQSTPWRHPTVPCCFGL